MPENVIDVSIVVHSKYTLYLLEVYLKSLLHIIVVHFVAVSHVEWLLIEIISSKRLGWQNDESDMMTKSRESMIVVDQNGGRLHKKH